MSVILTLEYRAADNDGEWKRMDPADRSQWQWPDAPDWLAAEALWMLGEGDEVRVISIGTEAGESYGDYTDADALSLNGGTAPIPEVSL